MTTCNVAAANTAPEPIEQIGAGFAACDFEFDVVDPARASIDKLGITQIGVTKSDVFTEQAPQASGLAYTILRHPIFLDQLGNYIGRDAYDTGCAGAARRRNRGARPPT
jgi:hypothetical protein